MARSKEGKESEYYQGIIRQLKSEVRNLQKQLKQLQKTKHIYEDNQLKDEDPIELPIGKQNKKFDVLCPDCKQAAVKERIIINRMFLECENCSWRSKATKIAID